MEVAPHPQTALHQQASLVFVILIFQGGFAEGGTEERLLFKLHQGIKV